MTSPPLRERPSVSQDFFGSVAGIQLDDLRLQEEQARREGRPFQEHETQQYLEAMVQALNQRARQMDVEFAQHMETQQGVQDIQRQQAEAIQEQQTQATGQELLNSILMATEDDPELQDLIAQQLPGLMQGPEDQEGAMQVKVLQDFAQQIPEIRARKLEFENQIARLFQEAAGERQAEEGGRLTEPWKSIARTGTALQSMGEGLVGGLTGMDFSRSGGILRSTMGMIDQAVAEQQAGGPGAVPGLTPDALREMLYRSAGRKIQQLEEFIGGEGLSTRAFGQGAGHIAGFVGGAKAVGTLAGKAATKLVPRLAATLGARTPQALAFTRFATKAGPMAGLFGYGYAIAGQSRPAHIDFAIQEAPESERAAMEEAYALYSGLQWSAALPFFHFAGALGKTAGGLSERVLGKVLPGEIAYLGGAAAGGYGAGLTMPEGGAAFDQLLQAVAQDADYQAMLKVLAANGEIQGPIREIIGKAVQGASLEETWDDIKDYLAETSPSASAMGILGFAGAFPGMGMRFRSRGEAEKRLREAEAEVDAMEDVDPATREAFKEVMRERVEGLKPSEAEEQARQARTELEAETGGVTEADRAVEEFLSSEKVRPPKGREEEVTTLEERREGIQEERERLQERPETEGTLREADALRLEERAAEAREMAMEEAWKTGDREGVDRLTARAEVLERAARDIREGKRFEFPTEGEVQEELARRPLRQIERELETAQRGPELTQKAVQQQRAKKARAQQKAVPMHERTRAEVLGRRKADDPRSALVLKSHQEAVSKAVEAGKPVPEAVLADYPHLQERVVQVASEKGDVAQAEQAAKVVGKARQAQVAKAKKAQPAVKPDPRPAAKATSATSTGQVAPAKADLAKTSGERPATSVTPSRSPKKRKTDRRQVTLDEMIEEKAILKPEVQQERPGGIFDHATDKVAAGILKVTEDAIEELADFHVKVERFLQAKKAGEKVGAPRPETPLEKAFWNALADVPRKYGPERSMGEAVYATLKRELGIDDPQTLAERTSLIADEFKAVKAEGKVNQDAWLAWGARRAEDFNGPWLTASRYWPQSSKLLDRLIAHNEKVLEEYRAGERGAVYIPGFQPVHRCVGAVVEFMRGRRTLGQVLTGKSSIDRLEKYAATVEADPLKTADSFFKRAVRHLPGRAQSFARLFESGVGQMGWLGNELTKTLADGRRTHELLADAFFGWTGFFRKMGLKEGPLVDPKKPMDLAHEDRIFTLLTEADTPAAELWPKETREFFEALDPKIRNDPEMKAKVEAYRDIMEKLQPEAYETSSHGVSLRLQIEQAQRISAEAMETVAVREAEKEAEEVKWRAAFPQEMERLDRIKTQIAKLARKANKAKKEDDDEALEGIQEQIAELDGERRSMGIAMERINREEKLGLTPLRTMAKEIANEKAAATRFRKWGESAEKVFQEEKERFGFRRGFVHHITYNDPARHKTMHEQTLDESLSFSQEALRKRILDIRDRKIGGFQLRRRGTLGEEQRRDYSVHRSTKEYIRELAHISAWNRFMLRNHDFLFGKIRRPQWGELANPGRSLSTQRDFYFDGATWRAFGEYVKLQQRVQDPETGKQKTVTIYRRTHDLGDQGKKQLAAIRAQMRAADIAGVRYDGPRAEKLIALSRGDAAENPKGMADPSWVARELERQNVRLVPAHELLRQATTKDAGYIQGLQKLNAAEYSLFKDKMDELMQEHRKLVGTALEKAAEKSFRKAGYLLSAKYLGFLNVPTAVNAMTGATVLNAATLGVHRAMADAHLPLVYFNLMAKAKLTGNTFRDLLASEHQSTAEGTEAQPFYFGLQKRVGEMARKSDFALQAGNREHFAEMAEDLVVSPILVGTRGTSFWTGPAKKGTRATPRAGDVGRAWGALASHATGMVAFDAQEAYTRLHLYMSSYMSFRKAGYDRVKARTKAENVTISQHGLFNKASKSAFLNWPAGRLLGAIMSWRWHHAGTFLRLPMAEQARLFAYVNVAALMGSALGMSLAQVLGVPVDEMFEGVPLLDRVADVVSGMVKGIGIHTEEDPTGQEKKSIVPVGEEARDAVEERLRGLGLDPNMEDTLVGAVRAAMGDFSQLPDGIITPWDPASLDAPGMDVFASLGRWGLATLEGDELAAERERNRFLEQLLVPGTVSWIRKAFFTEEAEGGGHVYTSPFDDRVRTVLEKRGIPQFVQDMLPGTSLDERMQWIAAQEARRAEEVGRTTRRSIKSRAQDELRILLDDEAMGGGDAAEARSEANRRLNELAQEAAAAGAPITSRDVKDWRRQTLAERKLDYQERAVLYAPTKQDQIRRMTQLLQGDITQERFRMVYQASMPESVLTFETTFAEWAQGISPATLERFRKAYEAAAERWQGGRQ